VSAGARERLEAIFGRAVEAADPERALERALERGNDGRLRIAGEALPPGARLVVLAVGKAAGRMARAALRIAGDEIRAGLAVAKEATALERIALRVTAHPLPDARCAAAAAEALSLVETAAPDDVLLVLLSGGASSLLAAPAGALALRDLARTSELLLECGAPIDEVNCVRKHLSAVAGGRLALRARSARIEVLCISDVPGDRLDVIGSGPFCADPSQYRDALAVLERRGLLARAPAAVVAHLRDGARGLHPETAKPGDARLRRIRHTLLASNRTALDAAALAARRDGLRPLCVTPALAGEARVAGRRLAALARTARAPQPLCLLAGGETTVTLGGETTGMPGAGSGRGGRSQELALAAALELAGTRGVALLAAGTDGNDGPTDAAGAFADGDSVARGAARGCDARAALAQHDAYGFFDAEGGLLRTGPTGTNVMDLALVAVGLGDR
jgi:glycerate-2-kinase